jgi:hypothetical protein
MHGGGEQRRVDVGGKRVLQRFALVDGGQRLQH